MNSENERGSRISVVTRYIRISIIRVSVIYIKILLHELTNNESTDNKSTNNDYNGITGSITQELRLISSVVPS